MLGTTVFLSFLVMVCVAGVCAENVTLTLSGNVTMVCNNASQCVGTAPGVLPFFFTALDANTTIPVVMTGSYEQNVTVVQNVTINVTQSNQTVTVNTQNITVVSCNESLDAASISTTVTNNIAAQLQTSLVSTCSTACKPGDDERSVLQAQKADAERQYRECVVMGQAAANISMTNYEHLNATLTQQVGDLESQQILTYTIFFIGMIFLVGGAVIVFRKGVLRNYIKGRATRHTPGLEGRE